ncbi:sensor kinase SpoOB-type protein [Tumebacillus sp. BK434]|uniref:sensor histidine kinase n=1 Tax=Tumebacillus sp. BK434 TaxID=2512169 RepID=UPI0010465AAB|nr:ATP-binding protein [Tumebacillus sp. BK434]TCP52580.1 sensor kinase SpoOB-type protein [Tumebacillus sp. BK434]
MYIYILGSLPEAIVNWYLFLTIVGLSWRTRAARHLVVCLLFSLAAYATYAFLPTLPLRSCANIFLFFLMIKACFRYSNRVSLIIALFYLVLSLAKETLFLYLLDSVSIFPIESVLNRLDHEDQFVILSFVLNVLSLLTGLFLSYFEISLSRWIYHQNDEFRRLSENICILFLVLFLLILSTSTEFLGTFLNLGLYKTVTYVVFIILFIGIFMLVSFAKMIEKQSVSSVENVYVENMKNLMDIIRSHRHDHVNQIYVVSNLLQEQKFEEAIEYLREYSVEVRLAQNLVNIGHLPLACLLLAKAELANQSRIQLEFDVQTTIPQMQMRSYELIQVIGNLVDNAIEEERKAEVEKRYIKLSVERLLQSMVVFKVYNANSFLSEQDRDAIFLEGHTSKEDHTGIGLSIVKRLSVKYEGQIEVESARNEGTTIYLFLPIIT